MTYEPQYVFDNLKALGFTAGIVFGGTWKDQAETYEFIRKRIAGGKRTIVSPMQTHGSEIVFINDGLNTDNISADGILSGSREICLTVRTADCVPVLMADPFTGVFGAVHVGWRGFVSGIVEELTAIIAARGLHPESIRFGLGPSIGQCCFETGDEVAILFDESAVSVKQRALLVNLRGAVMKKLVAAGADAVNIEDVDDCTVCSGRNYHSFRRTGDASLQMVSFIFRS